MNPQELEQYRAVREGKGISFVDTTESGFLRITGEDRFSWLQGMVTQDVRRLETDETTRLQACILNATGHLLADISLYNFGEGSLLMEIPAPQTETIYALLDRYLITEDVEIEDVSARVMRRISFTPPYLPEFADLMKTPEVSQARSFAGKRLGLPVTEALLLYKEILQKSTDVLALLDAPDLFPFFLSEKVQEVLRVEAGIPKWGNELDERVISLEANLGETHFSFTKGCYVGQEIIARIDSRGHTNRALTGLLVRGNLLPEREDKLFTMEEDARETGRITSVLAESPTLANRPIALGYVRHEHRTPGTTLKTESGVTLLVTGLPFYGATPAT